MPKVTITNNGTETVNVPLYSITLEPGQSADIDVAGPDDVNNANLTVGTPAPTTQGA